MRWPAFSAHGARDLCINPLLYVSALAVSYAEKTRNIQDSSSVLCPRGCNRVVHDKSESRKRDILYACHVWLDLSLALASYVYLDQRMILDALIF